MKKIFSFLLVLISLFSLSAENVELDSEKVFSNQQNKNQKNKIDFPKFSFSIEPLFGLKNGNFGEYVFVNETYYDTNKLSYLEWTFKNEYFAGTKLAFSIRNFFVQSELKFGFSGCYGIMQDYDWLNVDNPQTETFSNFQTNYSEHDNYLEHDINICVDLGWNFNPISTLTVAPILGFTYANTKFSGQNGWKQYGTQNGNYYYAYDDADESHLEKGTFSGEVINYMREAVTIWLGGDISYSFCGKFTFGKKLLLNAGFKIAPYSYAFNLDNHIITGVDFVDICEGFFQEYKINASINYYLTKKSALCFEAEYQKLNLIEGKTYSKTAAETLYDLSTSGYGGASSKSLLFSISYKFILGA